MAQKEGVVLSKALLRSPRYRHLSLTARALLPVLKAELGRHGIGALSVAGLADVSGFTPAEIEAVMDEFRQLGWLKQDGAIVWLAEGGEKSKDFRNSESGRERLTRWLRKNVPRSPIANQFAEFHGAELPFPDLGTKRDPWD